MKAYVFPLSPNARKVMAVAAHLDLPLDYQVVDPVSYTHLDVYKRQVVKFSFMPVSSVV